MRLFLDVEFTAFRDPKMKALGFPYSPHAKMLSLGLVSEDGHELYIETSDPKVWAGASEFVQDQVLTQFGLHPAVNVASSAGFGAALADFLEAHPGQHIICADYLDDLRFAMEALEDAKRLAPLADRVHFEQISAIVDAPWAQPLWESAFEKLEADSGLLRHHALLDARVLRIVYATAVA